MNPYGWIEITKNINGTFYGKLNFESKTDAMLHKRQQKANKIKQPPIDGIKITSRNERGKYLGILERDSFKQERCNERKSQKIIF